MATLFRQVQNEGRRERIAAQMLAALHDSDRAATYDQLAMEALAAADALIKRLDNGTV